MQKGSQNRPQQALESTNDPFRHAQQEAADRMTVDEKAGKQADRGGGAELPVADVVVQ